MAVKAVCMVKDFDLTSTGMDFKLKIYDVALNLADNVNCHTTLGIGDSPAAMNSDIAAFVKSYCQTNFSTSFGLLDTVKVLLAIDGLLS